MVHRSDNCPSVEILKEELMLSNELEMINEISYKQCVKTDHTESNTIITSVDEFVENLVAKLSTLCTHHFFTEAQSKYFSKTKDELSEGTANILADFSENYTCIMQDAIQSVHWKKEQVIIHPFLAYVKDTANDKLKPIPMVSDSTTTFTATLGSKTIPLTLQNEQYVACTYGINWWIGKIVECYDEYNDYKIMFMHPHGPSASSYMWPKPWDACWIPYENCVCSFNQHRENI
ncbi:hypothetical protein AVEN_143728-1 [Araneus ventricosus]|uniref:Uncharacterized protein n=1 Tax=Araneus ventricosus TaxID=182803 RepID=A0A4Y2AR17_ARAVE|nr:hypothetical protein AVEN_143728-1 [Araneus ventricosus]